MLDNQRPQKS